MVVAEILHGRAKLVELQADWDRLMERGGYEPSVSFEWTAALMESHIRKHDEVVFVILKKKGALIGIIPLVVRPTRVLGQTFIRVFPVSEFYNTHSDLLLEDVSEPVVAAFVDALYGMSLRWDVFSMTRLLEEQPICTYLSKALQRRGRPFEVRREQPSFYLELAGTFEGYLQRRSGSFRNALKRIERKLMSRGQIEVRSHRDYSNIDQAYDELLSIEGRSWKQVHGTSISSVSRQATFYRRLCSTALLKDWLHLSFLRLDGRPIAYNLGLIVNNTYYYLKTSYDHVERPLSPATLLRARLIEELIGRGVKILDFPGEPYEWERQWTDDVRWHRSLTLFGGTFKGLAYGLYRKINRLGGRNRYDVVTYVDPRAAKPGHA